MCVYNDAASIEKTVSSVCDQDNVDFEFIIVNDGSNSETSDILRSLAEKDSRIVLISQANQGLTKALINGCNRARGRYIARQDNGDISLENRLKSQLGYFNNHPEVAMLSCSTRFVAPAGEELYCVVQSSLDARIGLKQNSITKLKGPPHHGSVMFRRDAYLQVGGYRPEFSVAQDLDLWSRMVEVGEHHSIQEVYYQAVIEKNSISMLRRETQLNATKAIIDCAHARQNKGDDKQVLANYAAFPDRLKSLRPSAFTDSAYYYFLGSNLAKTDTLASSRYLRLATSSNPLHLKAWAKRAVIGVKTIVNTRLTK
jgi:glycosyltransferase involved in cell wall biosynthesis